MSSGPQGPMFIACEIKQFYLEMKTNKLFYILYSHQLRELDVLKSIARLLLCIEPVQDRVKHFTFPFEG